MQPQEKGSASGSVILALVLLNTLVLREGQVSNDRWHDALLVTLPLLMTALIIFSRKP